MTSLLKRIQWGKVGLFLISLWLFVLAITLMKVGARDFAPLVKTTFSINNTANSLGFGWLLAYFVMSGSPVAATALTFFDAGAIGQADAFAMITGSRLGASLIVLLIGVVYMLRGRDRSTSLGMGLLSLMVTGSTYLIAFFMGLSILGAGWLDHVQVKTGPVLTSVVDVLLTPIVDALTPWLPGWGFFLVGLLIIIISFNLFDRCLPTMAIKGSQVGRLSRLVYRPWVMFLLGALVTSISMSVSVSLSILVPLSNRGFVRRENVIPYIMGANITTFIDTLIAAVLLQNPPAFTIVLVEMLSIAIVSALVLLFFFSSFQNAVLSLEHWLIQSNRRLVFFIGIIFLVPLLLVLW
jgi:Na+/phosphate symporter